MINLRKFKFLKCFIHVGVQVTKVQVQVPSAQVQVKYKSPNVQVQVKSKSSPSHTETGLEAGLESKSGLESYISGTCTRKFAYFQMRRNNY
jgi:hypothetical protein